ncbi:MAG: ASKHA domain-containing protein [bacterium]|nr:ASKHA domain-containing protein [bacterium]
MTEKFVKVVFQSALAEKKIKVSRGTLLLDAAEPAEVYLDTPCGGKGICGKCRVRLEPVNPVLSELGKEYFTEQEWRDGWRLACQTSVTHDMVVHLPESLRKFAHKTLLALRASAKQSVESGFKVAVTPEPNIRKYFLILEPPNLARQKSDWEILAEKLPNSVLSTQQDLSILSQLPEKLRNANYQVTVTLTASGKIIALEAGDTSQQCYGIAFDIGTTTVVGTLLDLNTGKELAVSAEMNAQSVFGADVISRIQYAMQEPDGIKKLNQKIIEVINRIITALCRQAKLAPIHRGVEKNHIYEITVVGNTTMQHLVLHLSPATLGALPYVPLFKYGLTVSAQELRIRSVNPNALVNILPNIAGFVGADTVGVILATDAHRSEKLRLIIDLGTNSEIVLGNKNKLICCSAAAGPAFEAAHIEQGMRAESGAIDHVWSEDGDIRISTIDNLPPRGICGTGIIDAVAVMLQLGIVDSGGRIVNRAELVQKLSSRIKDRIIENSTGNKFILCHLKNEVASDREAIYLTQRDIREVQLAKGAIATGIKILQEKLNIADDRIEEVLLAGAFGHYILPESVITLGLISRSLAQKIIPVGNAASTGAKLALCSLAKREEAMNIAKNTDHLELALQPEFESRFAEALSFPE